MKFSSLNQKTKKQIKASMKGTALKLLKLNIDKLTKIESGLAFNLWTNRYINTHKTIRYYNLIAVEDELYNDLQDIMKTTFERELNKLLNTAIEVLSPKPFVPVPSQLPATEKQLNYASYLMNMVKNRPLPVKKYTRSEINILINHLKNGMKSV